MTAKSDWKRRCIFSKNCQNKGFWNGEGGNWNSEGGRGNAEVGIGNADFRLARRYESDLNR